MSTYSFYDSSIWEIIWFWWLVVENVYDVGSYIYNYNNMIFSCPLIITKHLDILGACLFDGEVQLWYYCPGVNTYYVLTILVGFIFCLEIICHNLSLNNYLNVHLKNNKT